VALGASPQAAKKWWTGEIARIANVDGKEFTELSVSPNDVAELEKLIGSGKLNDRLAREALAGVIAGEGTVADVVASRNLEVVSDDGALQAAVDKALAEQPDILEKIKAGKEQAAGAIIGAVMKEMRGQADAAKVREMVLERAKA
jgi:aspartyl-tRNA(Asn)/glutamyl-tRNA(Gln) amidotransferase subunit B